MTYKYEYGIIDGQYILRRNFAAMTKDTKITANELIQSFIISIIKLKRDHNFKKPIILFDKTPYKKSEGLKAYKGNRKGTWCPLIRPDDAQRQAQQIRRNLLPLRAADS